MAGGVPAKDFMTLAKGEKLVAWCPLNEILALGTRNGMVKRVNPDYPLNRDDWEAITLKPKDEVVGAGVAANDDDELVFITKGAQLLRFSASAVRPQGRTAGGMAGIKLGAGDEVVFFGVVAPNDPAAVVVTVSSGTRDPAGHTAAVGEGDRIRRVSGQGPGHRRRPGAPFPQGRGRPGRWRGPGTVRPRPRPPTAWPGHCPPSTAGGTAPAFRWPSPVEHIGPELTPVEPGEDPAAG